MALTEEEKQRRERERQTKRFQQLKERYPIGRILYHPQFVIYHSEESCIGNHGYIPTKVCIVRHNFLFGRMPEIVVWPFDGCTKAFRNNVDIQSAVPNLSYIALPRDQICETYAECTARCNEMNDFQDRLPIALSALGGRAYELSRRDYYQSDWELHPDKTSIGYFVFDVSEPKRQYENEMLAGWKKRLLKVEEEEEKISEIFS